MSVHISYPSVLKLRLLVGYLGETKQGGWWDTSFLDVIGRRFLENSFPRTALQAALRSACEAARIAHDTRIGRVSVYHLFRFPVDREDGIETCLHESFDPAWFSPLDSKVKALQELSKLAKSDETAPKGPVYVANEREALTESAFMRLAALYHSAFSNNLQCFPYFGTERNGTR